MSATTNDTELLAQLKTGSIAAFQHFYIAYRQWLLVTAMTILKNEEEARELVQEFFIDFWQNARYEKIDLTNIQTLKNFLFVSIKNRCLNKIAKDDTRKKRMKEIMLAADYTPPNNKLENNELKQQLENAINLLPERQLLVFRLAYLEHKTRKEIAAAMQISEETVKKQIANALKTLRTYLRKIQL
ncbi:RNA polymerase sigma-70 factor [Chitinophaga nivalis]|uniref:RNA polymerase sigma-70 factor n=1 Tax=Chitinophaga nivalis TaxID=2991709 RepID=A0ABT3ILU8_9BACT|nr:RNA polymerase sigma-70 factor [Chitinophaga nivalis]MCW3465355.1 RNA polymerase sigma-70 factor [Chitinophaga nivalis]MCW3484953.1 RNA polymerase sigma-70 factor [Chitinophaga nivalis]